MAEHKTGDFAGCIFWVGTVGLTKFEFQQEFQRQCTTDEVQTARTAEILI
jgi:hypothetical protein